MDNFSREKEKLGKNDTMVNRMDIMVAAMWELMLEKGFTREELNAKLDKVKEQRMTLDPQLTRVVCPVCGKLIKETQAKPFEGKCIYCGHVMTIYPGDSIICERDNEPLPDNYPSAPGGQDQV